MSHSSHLRLVEKRFIEQKKIHEVEIVSLKSMDVSECYITNVNVIKCLYW